MKTLGVSIVIGNMIRVSITMESVKGALWFRVNATAGATLSDYDDRTATIFSGQQFWEHRLFP